MGTSYRRENVLIGAAAMYVQPADPSVLPIFPPDSTPFTDVSSGTFTPWPAPWSFIGATDQGVTLSVQKNTDNVTIEEQSTPVFQAPTSTDIQLATALAEDTLSTMKLVYGGGVLTATASSGARTFTAALTSGNTTVTAAGGNFTAADVGKAVTGTGIPNGTTIASVTNSTTAVLSAAATATGASVAVTVGTGTYTPAVNELVLQEGIDTLYVGFEGRNPAGGPRRVLIPGMQINGQVSTPYRRSAKRLYPATFNAICSPTQVRIREIGV